jgi:hypothetical protein
MEKEGRIRVRRLLLASALLLASCGSDDGCAGFISVNASPERCAELAEEFGCSSFEATAPSCGLVACARCDGD